ncbi:MGS1 [[Candida] subhashii]|uniref:MGS1 n=1 Tax=[Candida] subhashii TaxID=561895 RepID=A0A8J5QDN6_9ASCO|nr:MGS1 [[Candida] subhashii]KAG7662976.1 MGS1 [[Candida] subhashii]
MNEPCPICSKPFPSSLLERHVNICLDTQEEIKATQANSSTDAVEIIDVKKRDAFSALGLKADSSSKKKPKTETKKNSLAAILIQERRLQNELKKKSNESNGSQEISLEDQFKSISQDAQAHIKEEKIEEVVATPPRTSEILARSQEVNELKRQASIPLAHRLRPKTLDDFYGQEKLLGKNGPLRTIIEGDHIPSFLLWGAPGIGKTTIARIIAKSTSCKFVELSGAESNSKQLRQIFTQAANHKSLTGQSTILFLDEIHRFNKAVQDLLLPVMEKGVVTVIGATTENPSFTLNNALLSRMHTFVMEPLNRESMLKILSRALYEVNKIRKMVYELHYISLSKDAFNYIADLSMGDSRIALNILESVNAHLSTEKFTRNDNNPKEGNTQETKNKQGVIKITSEMLKQLFKTKNFHQMYDRNGESHYDIISAFHKSVRGSDPDAAMFYLVKMLSGGEDPLFIMRRMIVIASEDIGLRDSSCLPFVVAAKEALEFVGMPEGEIILAHVTNKLARAPKSTKSYRSLRTAQKLISEEPEVLKLPVPLHLRNAPTKLMKELGYGEKYKYNPGFEHGIVKQSYFPDGMEPVKFLEDMHLGCVKDPQVGEDEYEDAKKAEEDYKNFKASYREKLREDYKTKKQVDCENPTDEDIGEGSSFAYDEFLSKEDQPQYSEDPDCTDNFGKSYDEFLEPDSQADLYEDSNSPDNID